jgi:hypothetical protein
MARKDLLRLGANVSDQLRTLRNDIPGGLSVVRKLSAESTWTRGHFTRIASSKDFSCELELWLDRWTGSVRYYATFFSAREKKVRFLAERAAKAYGKAIIRKEEDFDWVGDGQDLHLKPQKRAGVFRKPVLDLLPAEREFYFGRYFESLPSRQSRAETVLADAIVDCFRSVLAFASPVEFLDPATIEDTRKRTLASIVQRQGQGLFRRRLLEAYGRRCAITGCATEEVLEAVHITPYLGKATNPLSNGLLLRSDLHTLFDLGLIGVAPSTFALVLSQSLRNGNYARYAGKQISVPRQPSDQPAERALKQHLATWKLAI